MASTIQVDTIKDIGGNTIISSNGSGTFTSNLPASVSNTPTFSARSTSHQTGLTNGGWTKIQFDTAIFNVGSNYDTTNDKFVAPSNGKYFFTASLKIQSASGGNTLEAVGCRITINGSTMGDNVTFIATGNISTMCAMNTMILDLTATQYVEIYAFYQDSGGGTGSARTYDTMFHGCKLIT
tara:strand:- start:289 stop:831 length:543 start_codon:yes stop_codon:yes gene_type:complete